MNMENYQLNEDGERFIFSMRRIFAIGIIAILITIAFQSAIPTGSSAPQERILKYGTSEILDSGNPYVGLLDISYIYYGMIFDYLIFPDKDLIQTPNLAKSWWKLDGPTAASLPEPTDFSDSDVFIGNTSPTDWPLASIWEYNLTENVFWNDGTPFTADDVVWTYNIQLGINFMTYWAYQPTTYWMHHAEKVNDYKVRVFFSDHETGWPFPIAFGNYMSIPIMPKHYFADKSPTYLAYEWDGIPSLGTGPFMGTDKLRSEIIGKEFVTLVKNPFYDFIDPSDGVRKGLGGVYNRTVEVDKLILKIFSDVATLHLGIETGQVDCAIIEPGTYLQWKSRQENGTLSEDIEIVNMLPCTGFSKAFAINAFQEAPGTLNVLRLDPAVQRAATLATNRSFIIESVYKGLGVPGISIIATPAWPDWWWEPGDELSTFNVTDGSGNEIYSYSKPMKDVMDFDLVTANEILDAAGYEWVPGENVRRATQLVGDRLANLGIITNPSVVVGQELEFEMLAVFTDDKDKLMANYVSEEWENIGINAVPELIDDPTWGKLVYSYTFNVQFTYWSGDVDPNYLCFITTTMSLYGWNDFGIADPVYDNLFYQQAQAQTYVERKYWVDECIKYHYLSGSMIVTVFPKICYAYRTDNWVNWGDWNEHVGLGIDHFWGEAPIFYQIRWAGVIDDNGDGDGDDALIYAIIGGVIAAVAAGAIAALMLQKKKRKLLEEEILIEEEKEE